MDTYKKVNDQRKEIVEDIIQLMLKEPLEWTRPWKQIHQPPYNPISDFVYHGINNVRLTYAAYKHGWTDPRWLTFKQANEAGYRIKRGAKGVTCEYWNQRVEKEIDKETGEETEKVTPFVSLFYLYNAEVVEGIEPLPEPKTNVIRDDCPELREIADNLIHSSACLVNIDTNSDRAFYSPSKDLITIPNPERFYTSKGYVATLLHEMGHSTGHSSRLNRGLEGNINVTARAKEELVAELSSCFSQQLLHIDINDGDLKNHSAYVQSWCRELRKNPNLFFSAVREAEKASDYIIENYDHYVEQLAKEVQTTSNTVHEFQYFDAAVSFAEFCKNKHIPFNTYSKQDVYTQLLKMNKGEIFDPAAYDSLVMLVYGYQEYKNEIKNGSIKAEWKKETVDYSDPAQLKRIALINHNMLCLGFHDSMSLARIMENESYAHEERKYQTAPDWVKKLGHNPLASIVLNHVYWDLSTATKDEDILSVFSYAHPVIEEPEILVQINEIRKEHPEFFTWNHFCQMASFHEVEKLNEYVAEELKTNIQVSEKEVSALPKLLVDKEPTVTILFSENSALESGKEYTLSKADSLFYMLDQTHREEGYYKTDFQIHYYLHGEEQIYEGRQDLGDGEGGLINHIRNYQTYYLTAKEWKDYLLHKEGPEAAKKDYERRQEFIEQVLPRFELHCWLSRIEKNISEQLQPDREGEQKEEERKHYKQVLEKVKTYRTALNTDTTIPEMPAFLIDIQSTEKSPAQSKQVRYYPIDEQKAKLAHTMNSLYDYEEGSATAQYRKLVDRAAEIAEKKKASVPEELHKKIDALVDTYAKKMADNINAGNEIDTRVPSILVSGRGNFPVRQKEKQNVAREKNASEYQKIQKILDQIENVGVERTRKRAADPHFQMEDWTFSGGRVTANKEKQRIQIFFDSVPDIEIRMELKQNGFHWAPKEKAWQRQLTRNAYMDCRKIQAIQPVMADLGVHDTQKSAETEQINATQKPQSIAESYKVEPHHPISLFDVTEDMEEDMEV